MRYILFKSQISPENSDHAFGTYMGLKSRQRSRMLQLQTTINPVVSMKDNSALPRPLSLPEAARRAHLYALTGVPIDVQGNMRLAEALIYARQHHLHPPTRREVQSAFVHTLRP